MWRLIFLSTASALLTACISNPYSDFYNPFPDETAEAIAASRAAPAPKIPDLARVASLDDIAAYQRKGYQPIGYSSFSSGSSESDSAALKFGASLTADLVVVLAPQFQSSTTTDIPLTLPNTTTSQTAGNSTVSGPGGNATVRGNSTTTTYGTKTTYIPMTINRYEYGAVYMVKRRYKFGATYRDLTNQERQELQSNKGVVVAVVVDGTPAFDSDILIGDFIVSLNGAPVSIDSLGPKLGAKFGQKVEIGIIRSGQLITKSVQLLE